MAETARTLHLERILALEVPIVVRLAVRVMKVSEVTALPSQRTCLPLDSMVSCCR